MALRLNTSEKSEIVDIRRFCFAFWDLPSNDYITQSVGVLSKHGRSLKGIRRVEVFDIDPGDAMTVNRRLPLTFDLGSKSSCRRARLPVRQKQDHADINLWSRGEPGSLL